MSTIDHPAATPARGTILPQLGGLYAIWLREVKRAIRDRGQLIGGVSRPLLWVLIMGIGLNPYFRGEVYGEVRFVVPYTYLQFIFPAVIALNIMYTSVQSAVSTIWDREFGFLREILVSPLPRATMLLGKMLGGTTVAMFHGCARAGARALCRRRAHAARHPARPRPDVPARLRALTSLGVVIANRVRSFEGFGVFSNAVILPLYFTSSSIFPLDPSLTSAQTRVVYPEWLVTLVQINPLTYAVDSLRGAFIHFHQFDPRLGPLVLVGHGGGVLPDRAARLSQGLSAAMAFLPASLRRILPYVLIFGLLAGVYLLPPDTSLARGAQGGPPARLHAAEPIRRSSPAIRRRPGSTSSCCGRWRRSSALTLAVSATRRWRRTSTRATGTSPARSARCSPAASSPRR